MTSSRRHDTDLISLHNPIQRRRAASMDLNNSTSLLTLPPQEPAFYDGRISRDAFKVCPLPEEFGLD